MNNDLEQHMRAKFEAGLTADEMHAMVDIACRAREGHNYTRAYLVRLLFPEWKVVGVAKLVEQRFNFSFETAKSLLYNGQNAAVGFDIKVAAQALLDAMTEDERAAMRADLLSSTLIPKI